MTRVRRTPARAARHLVVGAREVTRALEAGTVRRVLVALDAPRPATDAVRLHAAARGLDVVAVTSALELGRRCGVPRPVAAAGELAFPPHRPAQVAVPQRR